MSRAVLAAIGGLALAVLLGALGLSEASTSPQLAVGLFVCALSIGGVVALALVALYLRTTSDGGSAEAAGNQSSAAGGRRALRETVLATDHDRGEPAAAVEPGLLAAVEASLHDAIDHPASAGHAAIDVPEWAVHADANPGRGHTPGFSASRFATGRRTAAGSASTAEEPVERSALLDALQEMHEDELVSAIDVTPDAPPDPGA